MRIVLIVLIGIFCTGMSNAQTNPVTWSGDVAANEFGGYTVTLRADIETGWYLYSQHLEDGGPIPTQIAFNAGNYDLRGGASESGAITKEGMDKLFGINITKFGDQALFKQNLYSKDLNEKITGTLEYMSCNDVQCTRPLRTEFKIDLKSETISFF